MSRKILFVSLASLFAAAGCHHPSESDVPQEDADASDDAAAPDGQDLQEHDTGPDAPDAPDGGDPVSDPRPEDTPFPDDGHPEDVTADDATDPEESDVSDAEGEEVFEPYPAIDFTLTDYNPDSATYLQERTLSGARGKVIVLYFLSYG